MKALQAKCEEEERTQQNEIESWQEQDGASIDTYLHTESARNRALPKWSDVFGCSSPEKKMQRDVVRKPPSGHVGPVVNMPPPLPPHTTHDMREDQLSQGLKIVLGNFQEESEVHVLVELLEKCSKSRHVRENIIKVFELNHLYNGQGKIHPNPQERNHRDCKVKLVDAKREREKRTFESG